MGVISNRDQPFQELLHEHGIGEYFDFALAAGEVQVWKPDPGLFEHALERVGLAPADAIYVGDNYYADVVGSRSAGLKPVLYDPLGIFPDPDCTTIKSFDELNSVINVI
jgi:putative hydrolase of the HAD superfamily